MASLGEMLRRERMAKGIELESVSAETRISVRYLEALENDDWGQLPGLLFSRSFARQYGRIVGLPEEEIERELDRLGPAATAEVSMQPERGGGDLPPIPEAVGVRRAPSRKLYSSAIWLLMVVVICTGAYVLWSRAQDETPAGVAPPPLPAPVATELKPASEPPAPPPVAPAAVEPVVVQVAAKATVWISLSADGRSVHVGNIEANDSRTVRAREEIRLRTGNAGLTTMTWNGADLGAPGPLGQVRTVLFRADRYEVLPARTRAPVGSPAPEADPPA
jgi:cytoskeleton protein RodZ